MSERILVIDDDKNHREGMVLLLQAQHYLVDEANGAEAAMRLIRRQNYDLVITDYKMQEIDGMELLKMINDYDPLLKVIMVTGFSSIEHAVEAVHLGATDYIPKPVDPVRLKEVIARLLSRPAPQGTPSMHFDQIIGQSRPMRQLIKKINDIADIDVPVLIYGASGTGKELVAQAIHKASQRREKPFVPVNTGAIPRELIASELFGHEKGAFTGAVERKKGRFEEADGGTLFLDEISSMSEEVQVALLRVLETQTVQRIGSAQEIKVDVRIVAATNEDMGKLISEKRFRDDLYYRLNVYSIDLPPLNERVSDIPMLVDYFIYKFNKQYKRNIAGIDDEALEILQAYGWPGNVRELRNIVLRAMISAKTRIGKRDLPEVVRKGISAGHEIRFPAGTPLPEIERESIIKTLKMAKGNKLKAAEMLSISRRSLYNKLEEYDIREDEYS
ncbi:MAG: sigma-54-dependent Fis family transcriptional regulator [Calditrichaeota bacterium]|nr:MAG: sigma-54-dependent Fis family transcriptional regulator [Calditrichota bacterium]